MLLHHLRRWLLPLLLVLGAPILVSCDSEPEDPALRAAAIARQIQADPDGAEAILEEHELTIEEFEALMVEIAADAELSERYDQALEAD